MGERSAAKLLLWVCTNLRRLAPGRGVRQLTPPHPHHFMSSTPFCGILDAPIQVFLLGSGETEVVKGIWGASGRVCSVRHVDEQECRER